MSSLDDRYVDLLDGSLGIHQEPGSEASQMQLLHDLDATYRMAAPPRVRGAVARALDERARHTLPRRSMARAHGPKRWSSIAAALALALGGLLGYVRLEAPAPVSAATVLRQALAARPAATPAQLIHETGTLYINGPFDLPDQKVFTPPMNLTIDQWTQLDAAGAVSQQVTTAAQSNGMLVVKALQTGASEQIYGTLHNAITTESVSPRQNYAWLANPLDISDVPGLVASAETSATSNLQLLPIQTLDGVVVDVVQIKTFSPDEGSFPHSVGLSGGDLVTTMYIDAHTYTIRGVDVSTMQGTGPATLIYGMRVTGLNVVPASSAPAGTFTLDAPAGARSLPPVTSSPTNQINHAAPPVEGLLLPSAPDGLQLGQLTQDIGTVYATTSVTYCASGHCVSDPPGTTQFVITFARTEPPSSHIPPLLAADQPTPITIAGVPVQAYYVADPAPLGGRRLIYLQGTTLVELYSQGLSQAEFFNAVHSAVDARTHAELIPAKWRRLGLFDAGTSG